MTSTSTEPAASSAYVLELLEEKGRCEYDDYLPTSKQKLKELIISCCNTFAINRLTFLMRNYERNFNLV